MSPYISDKLNLAFFCSEIEVECEECGESISIPEQDFGNLPDYVVCSTCAAEIGHEWRMKKLRKEHRPVLVDEAGNRIRIPPMIHIDTRDLPGFYPDDLAKKIGKTLELFKK